jgi:putative aldouronate transport system permease protein
MHNILTPNSSQLKRKGIRKSVGERLFDILNILLMLLLALVTLGPFLYIIFGSLTEANFYRTNGVTLDPTHWSLVSYTILLSTASRLLPAFMISVLTSVVGTILGLLITSSLAFVVSRYEMPGHNLLIWLLFFTMIFNGGMVPFYLVVNGLKLTNSIWSMVIPFLSDVWFIFIMVKFFESLPQDLFDSARIDGCTDIGLYFRIVLPLSKPVLATIGLFFAVYFWNQWFWPMVFIQNSDLHPLQMVLRAILSSMMPVINPNAAMQQAQQTAKMPPVEVLRMAAIIVTILPIAVVYPFLQRYFVKGVMIGAIKG